MKKQGKRYSESEKLIEKNKQYGIKEALEIIEKMPWKIVTSSLNSRTPKDAYTYEITNVTLTDTNNIGLMYVSDYGYAASPIHWNKPLYNSYNADYESSILNNWMYMGWGDWTISGASGRVHAIDNTGAVNTYYATSGLGVRPTFYLKSNILYQSGNGSIDSPFRLSLSN